MILSPVFIVLALAVWINDPGPIFFRQKRVGKNKEFFMLHKFRTMKVSTPHDLPTHQLLHPEQYITGYTTQYRDMGNGYFETYEVPQYGTRYRTEEYQERVYRQEPVYDTWYQYTVQRWQYDRTLTASGTDDAPYWPELTLAADTEREGGRDEEYRIVFADKDGTYPLRMTQGEWEKYSVGDAVVLTVSPSGNVQEIKKK